MRILKEMKKTGIHKMVQSNLLNNSIAAYFAAIEIHNKPNISYRYETVTLLMMNAWELLLKAFVKKYVKKQSIYTDRERHTISLAKAIIHTENYINTIEPKSFSAIKENILLIEQYRNNVVHFYNEQLEPYIFMLTAKAVLNFVEFIRNYFGKDIMADEGLFILPLGFKLPFKPEAFLTTKAANSLASEESKQFVSKMVKIISELNVNGIEDTIVVGFNIYLENVKKMKNADILAAITSTDLADASFTKIQKVQLVHDSNATKVHLSDDEVMNGFPLTYADVCQKCKEQIGGFKQSTHFNEIMREIKKISGFSYTRKLDPNSKKTTEKVFYTKEVIDEIQRRF